jgi:uroporphyrinogen decarboxylase
MDSKERVMTALHHQEPDRVPVNFRSTDEVIAKLSKRLVLDYRGLLEHFQVDFREVIPAYTGPELSPLPDGSLPDIWGVGRKEVVTDNSRDVLVTHNPLKELNDAGGLDSVNWPTPDHFDFADIDKMCDGYAGFAVSTEGIHAEGYHGVFHLLTYLYGMEKVMMDLVLNEELVQQTIDRIMDYFVAYYSRLFEAGKGKIDFLFYKDDFGTQNSLLISRDMFVKFFKPTLQKLVDLTESFDSTLILHSCGNVLEIIPDLIDAGVKVLDPIQVTAKGMDIDVLKQKYGEKLTFHGAIDTQQLLPRGTPEEVKKTVENTIAVLGKGGGYFFSPSHRLQQDTPVENVLAMYEAALETTVSS